ncbi:unnamed protein product [Brassicogethes aeneus]|uniref:UDP-glucuronosyltransferase n=1 Tax=Brassicogethes aeneus TaxID=1431903 RepID=A0A9P0AV47_BRAAE|nr:unnamed protein product [Brassicogethes aeneus]
MKVFVLICAFISWCDGARILGIIPMPSFSHQIPFRPIWRELSLRGHQVTVLTTDPMRDPQLTNLTEIDLGFSYEVLKKHGFPDFAADDSLSFRQIGKKFALMINELSAGQLSSPQVKQLIGDESIEFDLLVVEAQIPIYMGFAWRFNCPSVGIASLDANLNFHDSIGNPTHPVLNPDPNLPIVDPDNMTFKERLASFLYIYIYKYLTYNKYYPLEDGRFKKFFGDDAPTLLEVQNNISFVMVSTNPIFHSTRAANPNTIFIGNGLHIGPPKPLPTDLQEYLDSSKNGVIYFSLGSNVKGHLLNDTIKRNILQAFSELPYNVLMKMDTDLKDVPKNVKIQKWLPQQDVLRHPNIKLFISQGGLQSLQESITNGIPLVGIPFFGDQISNVYRMVKKGYGVRVDKNEITKENFKQAILEVLNNPRYREKAKEMGELLHDEPMTSLEKAVWWIEYVIRHKGAKHLRSPAVDMPAWKYYMLDVIGSVLGALFIVLFLSYKILKCVISKLLFGKPKAKKD